MVQRKPNYEINQSIQIPKKVLYNTDWFPTGNEDQQRMTDSFVEKLEAVLGITHTKISFSDEWARSRPEKSLGKSLKDYLAKVSELWFASGAFLTIIQLTVGLLA